MKPERLRRRAELASAAGAGILGIGLGAVFHQSILYYVVFIIVLGLVMHSWGMWDKHRLEIDGEAARVWWSETLYIFCWMALALITFYIGLNVWK